MTKKHLDAKQNEEEKRLEDLEGNVSPLKRVENAAMRSENSSLITDSR
jgi:hypothetical protein